MFWFPGGVAQERLITISCVAIAVIVTERLEAGGRVAVASYVVLERSITDGRVPLASVSELAAGTRSF